MKLPRYDREERKPYIDKDIDINIILEDKKALLLSMHLDEY